MCNVRTPLDVVVLMLSCIRVKCFYGSYSRNYCDWIVCYTSKAKQKAHPANQCKLRMMLMPWNTLNVMIVTCYLYWNDYSYDEIRWGTIYSDWNGKESWAN